MWPARLLVMIAIPEAVETEFLEILPPVPSRFPGQILICAKPKPDGLRVQIVRHVAAYSSVTEAATVRNMVNWGRILRKNHGLSMKVHRYAGYERQSTVGAIYGDSSSSRETRGWSGSRGR